MDRSTTTPPVTGVGSGLVVLQPFRNGSFLYRFTCKAGAKVSHLVDCMKRKEEKEKAKGRVYISLLIRILYVYAGGEKEQELKLESWRLGWLTAVGC